MGTEEPVAKSQNFFQQLDLESDGKTVLQSLILKKGLLQLKSDKSPENWKFSILKADKATPKGLIASFKEGPFIDTCDVTITFEVGRDKYFASGRLTRIPAKPGELHIDFKKIFKLQRRDFF